MPLEKLPQLLARLYLRKIQHLPDSFTLRSHGWSAVANAQSITHFPAAIRNSDVLSDRSLHMSRLFPFLPVSEDSLKMYDDVNDKTFLKSVVRLCFEQADPVQTELFSGPGIIEQQRQLQARSSRVVSKEGVLLDIETEFLQTASSRGHHFKYRVSVQNQSKKSVQVVSRHWRFISDRDDDLQVIGDGILGKMPILAPGDTIVYSSFSGPLKSDFANMSGSLLMRFCEINDLPNLDLGCGFSAIQLEEGQPFFNFLSDGSYKTKSDVENNHNLYNHTAFSASDDYFSVDVAKTLMISPDYEGED
jgi:ApaG protein